MEGSKIEIVFPAIADTKWQCIALLCAKGIPASAEERLTVFGQLMGYPTFTAEAVYSKIARQIAPTTLLGEDGAILLDDINHIRRIWFQPRLGGPEELGYREKLPNNMKPEVANRADAVDMASVLIALSLDGIALVIVRNLLKGVL